MKPRFEPELQSGTNEGLSPTLIDPEAYDASEQTFAASLEPSSSPRTPKFVVDEESPEISAESEPKKTLPPLKETCVGERPETGGAVLAEADLQQPRDPDSWRREVADRLSHYRARRRPRAPRYPSLQLKFESEQVSSAPESVAEALPATPAMRQTVDYVPSSALRLRLDEPSEYPRAVPPSGNESTAKVIEFASYSPAPRPFDELAEPVLARPRIIEAPELAPPPPALGGILIEPIEEPANERRPGFEIPLQAAPMVRRIAAAGLDAALVISAIAAFAYVFFRITNVVPPSGKLAGTAACLIGLLWSAYQYLFLVHTGSTPGLKLARLALHRFDGDPVPRRMRRWRVLASALSGVSLGLGYAWCLLDEDQLCWHDRITRTYMAPKK